LYIGNKRFDELVTLELEVQVLTTLHMYHGTVYICIILIIANYLIRTISGPISSEIRTMPNNNKEKDKKIKGLEERYPFKIRGRQLFINSPETNERYSTLKFPSFDSNFSGHHGCLPQLLIY